MVERPDDPFDTAMLTDGDLDSDPAKLEVTLPVSITGQPADTHVVLDGTLALSVTATGTGPFEYQWYRGDEKIEGAVEADMQLPNMTRLKDGLYRVEVKNLLGAMFSREAAVVVDEPVTITVQPGGATLLQGEDAVMWALATGSEPLSYQWQKDGVALEGQTETSLNLANAVEADEGVYTVIITNPVGFEVSAEALVIVNSPPTIEPLDPVVVSAGDAMQIQVVADDADGAGCDLPPRDGRRLMGLRVHAQRDSQPVTSVLQSRDVGVESVDIDAQGGRVEFGVVHQRHSSSKRSA